MTNLLQSGESGDSMGAMDAIYQRRSVRNYAPATVDEAIVRALLDAAVHAPTAMDEEPWAFAVIHDENLLNRLSESVKESVRAEARGFGLHRSDQLLKLVDKPDFHVFHHASTLIVILGRLPGPFVAADCWLAAENLMLAACAKGLGTCVIGLAVQALNTPEWRAELKIPAEFTAIAPVVVGFPAGETPSVPRKQPEIFFWR
jgi:nitroreductase